MMRKRGRRDDWNGNGGAAPSAPLFNLDELHERRILSWSPELDDELEDAEEDPLDAEPEPQPAPAPAPPQAVAPPTPSPAPAPTPAPAPVKVAAEPPAPVAKEEVVAEKRGRGRPRGRPRRQVHFHVDPDEEVLLMGAVEKFGSQQKGLIGALQALHDIEFVRDEVERLAAECERQRKLLDQAESIFGR